MHTDSLSAKDRPGWDFIIKRAAATNHEDIAIYKVSSSSLTMELETVLHALRWFAKKGENQTTASVSISLLLKIKSGMGSTD